jgi:hypothetical protein
MVYYNFVPSLYNVERRFKMEKENTKDEDTIVSTDIIGDGKGTSVNVYEFIRGLDVSETDKNIVVGCISTLMYYYAASKAKITLAAACGLELTDEKFVTTWNKVKGLILDEPNEIYHSLLVDFDLESGKSSEEEEDCKQQN